MLLSINELVHLYVPTFVFAHFGAVPTVHVICFMMFTLHRHHCSFTTDKDLTHISYTNLIIYKNKEAR